jgi:hypothetical protein
LVLLERVDADMETMLPGLETHSGASQPATRLPGPGEADDSHLLPGTDINSLGHQLRARLDLEIQSIRRGLSPAPPALEHIEGTKEVKIAQAP